MWVLSHPLPDLFILLSALGLSLLIDRAHRDRGEPRTSTFDQIAGKPALCYFLIGTLAFLGSAAVSLIWEFPQPRVHDEFSYLLAADTFSHGKLTNPTHPRWQHFESFHILQRPTYASRYPPGQGLVLALGTKIGGHPIVGVWLSAAIGSAAVYWMAKAWLPPSWALLASLLAVLRIGIGAYWSQSYMGGWVAALGGALLFGGLRRTIDRPSMAHSVALAAGLIVLANSRPFEGLLVALPCAMILLIFMIRRYLRGHRDNFSLIVLPLSALLLLNLLWIGAYNKAVTGNPWKLPHQLYLETYMTAPYFLFQPPNPRPEYRHQEMARLHTRWEQQFYERQISLRGWFEEKRLAMEDLWGFYLGVGLTLPLLLLPLSRRDPWILLAAAFCLLYLAAAFATMGRMPHYSAPLAPLVFLLAAHGVRAAYDSPRWHLVGHHLRRVLPLVCLAILFYGLVNPNRPRSSPFPSWHLHRARILKELEVQGGHHLIIVRYRRNSPPHYPHEEWVYNEADIDSATVVWAREMARWKNLQLLRYFKNRTVWLLEPDVEEPHLQRYPGTPANDKAPG